MASRHRANAETRLLPVVLTIFLITLTCTPSAVRGALPSDNISVQWNRLFMQLFCTTPGIVFEPSTLLVHLNLAQWHALIALKQTGGCTTEDAVVAYASRTILANYFPFSTDTAIDPLLLRQLAALALSKSQKRLGKRLGEAVATRLVRDRQPLREFVLEDVRAAILARQANPAPGLFRFLPNSPHNESTRFVTHDLAVEQPLLIPDSVEFIHDYLSHLKAPKVPSREWDAAYDSLVDVGRIDWPGRTAAMNFTASIYSCPKLNVTFSTAGCTTELFWINAALDSLPATTSRYDAITLLAKMSVAFHDANIVITTMKDGFWFWRPAMAYRAGDADHAPIPGWTPYAYTLFDPEYPSGVVGLSSTGATILQSFFGDEEVGFTLTGNGYFGPTCPGSPGLTIGDRHFDSPAAAVEEAKLGRFYSGAHYNISTRDGAVLGKTVANYVLKHWANTTPSGVLPATEYLNVFAQLPKKAGQFLPVQYEF